ncbi:MAG TPA: hypothetical protein DCF87_04070 [Opitutae bacterium]|nr:hypothetical protein [Opitutae bacterium]
MCPSSLRIFHALIKKKPLSSANEFRKNLEFQPIIGQATELKIIVFSTQYWIKEPEKNQKMSNM